MNRPTEHQHTPAVLSRRTIVRGAAWSIPVIAAGAAIPYAAASTTPDLHPDLAIVLLQNAPTDGVVQYWADNGEPGYHARKQLTHHIRVANLGEAAATGFTLDLRLHAASYLNGSVEIPSADGWIFAGGRPNGDMTVTLTFSWTGNLEPGQNTEVLLRLRVSENLPAGQTHVTPSAAIISVVEGDNGPGNNHQVGTPSYWVS